MRTIVQFLILTVLYQLSGFTQQITNKVITNAGTSVEKSDISISFTIGEPMVNIFATPDSQVILTQGFQQPFIIIESVNIMDKYENVQIKAFPNPVMSMLNVSIQNYNTSSDILVKIVDLLGKQYEMPCFFNPTNSSINISIDFKEIHSGDFYIILIDESTSDIISELKIIKLK